MFSKKTKTKNLRSILESPFHVRWPEKRNEELLPLQNALTKLLPAARLEESKIQTNMFEGKEAKGKSKIKMKQKNIYRNFLAPGYQSVVRGMEKKELCCAVFSSDVTPLLLLKVALTCAQTSTIPTIVIPNLKTITSSALGFATMALGFKTVVAEFTNNPFHEIFKIICENPTIIETPFTTKPKASILKIDQTNQSVTENDMSKKYQANTESVYLFRKPNGQRAFIPNCKTENLLDVSLKTKIQNPYGYISLGEPTRGTSLTRTLKNQSAVKETYFCGDNDDDDDSDSDRGNVFFVDNIPDESLFKTSNVNSASSQRNNLKFRSKKKVKGINNNVQDVKKTGLQFLRMSAHKASSSSTNLNTYCENIKFKSKKASSNVVKFQPLRVKTVTVKVNKKKNKKNKRLHVKNK